MSDRAFPSRLPSMDELQPRGTDMFAGNPADGLLDDASHLGLFPEHGFGRVAAIASYWTVQQLA